MSHAESEPPSNASPGTKQGVGARMLRKEDDRFMRGRGQYVADIRLAATLEFLRSIDYELPAWVEDYFEAMEGALGDAYTEPAADVRGYVQSVKQPEIAPS